MRQGPLRKRIPVAGPWVTRREVTRVAEAAARGWYAQANLYVEHFEKAFARYLGAGYAVSLPSCTSAIHLSLLALGIGPGDEVVVPDITWIASAAPVSYVGARPVFADIDEETWCLSPDSFRELITPRTKAVIVVDLYGTMPDMGRIRSIAKAQGIRIIEDAAQAVGSEYRGKKAGRFGDTGVFSFHGTKTLTTGEGGMLVTDSRKIDRRCRFLRDHGRAPGKKMFWNAEVAWKYRMSSLQAAFGAAQLERIEELLDKKRRIFSWYQERLGGIEGIMLNAQPPGTRSTYWMVTAILDSRFGLAKEQVISALARDNMDSRPFFYPLSSLPAYRDLPGVKRARERNRVAYSLSPRGVNLPSALTLTERDVAAVCRSLRNILSRAPRKRGCG